MITTINEFRKHLNEMHGEAEFNDSVIQHLQDTYNDLIVGGHFEELKKKIEIDYPSLDADLVVQYWTGPDPYDNPHN